MFTSKKNLCKISLCVLLFLFCFTGCEKKDEWQPEDVSGYKTEELDDGKIRITDPDGKVVTEHAFRQGEIEIWTIYDDLLYATVHEIEQDSVYLTTIDLNTGFVDEIGEMMVTGQYPGGLYGVRFDLDNCLTVFSYKENTIMDTSIAFTEQYDANHILYMKTEGGQYIAYDLETQTQKTISQKEYEKHAQ